MSFAIFFVLWVSSLIGLSAASNEEGLKFLEENGKKPGVVTLPSGLQYKVLKRGDGRYHPQASTPCLCHYEGKLINGDKFDSSYDRGEPTTFAPNQVRVDATPLQDSCLVAKSAPSTFGYLFLRRDQQREASDEVIKGWTEAMQLMVKGDKWELYIPSELGYGDRGSPPKIPGASVLVFQMEIVDIKADEKDLVPAARCNPATKEDCNEKEVAYIAKIADWVGDKHKAEFERLQKMLTSKSSPELMDWMKRRWSILQQLVSPPPPVPDGDSSAPDEKATEL